MTNFTGGIAGVIPSSEPNWVTIKDGSDRDYRLISMYELRKLEYAINEQCVGKNDGCPPGHLKEMHDSGNETIDKVRSRSNHPIVDCSIQGMTDKFIITGEQIKKLCWNCGSASPAMSDMQDEIRSNPLADHDKQVRENVLDEIFPKSTGDDKKKGWTYDYRFVETLEKETSKSEWDVGMEGIEDVLKALEQLLRKGKP